MKDEIYPPPRVPHRQPDAPPAKAAPRGRKLYTLLSVVFLLLAIALNMTNNTNLISFKAKPDELPAGVSEVAVTLQNRSMMELHVSRIYSLERHENGEWRAVASNSGTQFDTATFFVGRFDSVDLTFGRYGVFEPLAPGEYRVAIDVFAPRAFIGPAHSFTLYAAFTVKPD